MPDSPDKQALAMASEELVIKKAQPQPQDISSLASAMSNIPIAWPPIRIRGIPPPS
jgi:HrpA-like RNA helicase